jgi:hypothetical protein
MIVRHVAREVHNTPTRVLGITEAAGVHKEIEENAPSSDIVPKVSVFVKNTEDHSTRQLPTESLPPGQPIYEASDLLPGTYPHRLALYGPQRIGQWDAIVTNLPVGMCTTLGVSLLQAWAVGVAHILRALFLQLYQRGITVQ